VSEKYTVNLASLNMVKTELLNAIQQAGAHIEQFISNRDKQEFLDESLAGLKEILGIIQVVQLKGAELLTQEMIELLSSIPVGADETHDQALSVLSTGFFILPRYFEYSQQTERCLPVLLLPFINDIRIANNKAPLSESQFFTVNVSGERPSPPQAVMPPADEFVDLVRRLRHMYQVGLLGVLLDNKASYSLGLMKRAVDRLDKLCGDKPLGKLWWLSSAALEAIESESMGISTARKFMFSAVDRRLKQLHKSGVAALDEQPDDSLVRDLVYISAVSGSELETVKGVKAAFGVAPVELTEAQISQEQDNLRGPEMGTVHSVAEVIKEELRNTKNRLESASQGVDMVESYAEVIESMQKVSEILSVVGLVTASATLREQVGIFSSWAEQKHEAERQELLDAADALLYVESTISALEKINLSPERLAEANSLAKDEVIATSHLAEAEQVVLDEAQSGLSLVKRAITSFEESNYDRNHISNLGKSLNAVRGALVVLNMKRAAEICNACVVFVEQSLLEGENTGAIGQILETFADAVISLEYYLEGYVEVGSADDSILDIAEESVNALGYPLAEAESA